MCDKDLVTYSLHTYLISCKWIKQILNTRCVLDLREVSESQILTKHSTSQRGNGEMARRAVRTEKKGRNER